MEDILSTYEKKNANFREIKISCDESNHPLTHLFPVTLSLPLGHIRKGELRKGALGKK